MDLAKKPEAEKIIGGLKMSSELGEYLSENELAKLLKASRTLLWRLRRNGLGPRFVTIGRKILYRMTDVNRWVEENSHQKYYNAKRQARS
jgi:predicted DNA-binding transcriptional regulator AlpA